MSTPQEKAIKVVRELLDVIEALDSSPMQRDSVPTAVRNAAKKARECINGLEPQPARLLAIENAAMRVATTRHDGIVTDQGALDRLDAALEVSP